MEKIQQLKAKGKDIFRKRPRLVIGIVIILALSLPFIVNQVLKQQDLRQRAGGAPSIKMYFGKPSTTLADSTWDGIFRVGDRIVIGIFMDTGTNDIGALHYKVNYSSGLIKKDIAISIAGPFTPLIQEGVEGTYRVAAVNPTSDKVTGSSQGVMKFEFTAIQAGNLKITLDEIQATAYSYDTYVPIENAGSIIANLTIVDSNISMSPTPACKTGVNSISFYEPCDNGNSRFATYVCYDGYKGTLGDPTSCKSFDLWKTYAIAACDGEGRTSCTLTPTIIPSTSPDRLMSPTPTPIGDTCAILDSNRPLTCACENNFQCDSGYCDIKDAPLIMDGRIYGTCELPPVPLATPTPTVIGDSCDNLFGWFCPPIDPPSITPYPTISSISVTPQPTGLTTPQCNPDGLGEIDIFDFNVWRDEYFIKPNTTKRSACLAPDLNIVDIFDFNAWRDIYILKLR